MSHLFGPAPRAALTDPRPRITTDQVRSALATFSHPDPHVRIALSDAHERAFAVTDRDQTLVGQMDDLAREMTKARVLPGGVPLALQTWVEYRPVSAAEAADRGYLILDWADPTHTRLVWILVVPRLHGVLAPFVPPLMRADVRAQIRAAARDRSAVLPVAAGRLGAITLLGADPSGLSTAPLVNPDSARAKVSPDRDDSLLVVTPGSPIACGSPAAIARLSQDTNEPHAVLTWAEIPPVFASARR